jgi:hypothetical protein
MLERFRLACIRESTMTQRQSAAHEQCAVPNSIAQPNLSDDRSLGRFAHQTPGHDDIEYLDNDWLSGETTTEEQEAGETFEQEDPKPDVANKEADTISREADSGHPVEGLQTGSKPNVLPAAAEVFDRRGDLQLIAGQEQVTFRVCSRSLARSSPVWDTMLYGPFTEGKDQQNTDNWTITLPEDNPDALRILMKAVHSQSDTIPKVLSEDDLFHLALLCDKYDMVGLFKSFWNDWVSKLGVAPRTPSGFVHRLWIGYTLGYRSYYKITLTELMGLCKPLEGKTGLFLEGYDEENLCENIHLQALGIVGK